jgi:hypothetical protein
MRDPVCELPSSINSVLEHLRPIVWWGWSHV